MLNLCIIQVSNETQKIKRRSLLPRTNRHQSKKKGKGIITQFPKRYKTMKRTKSMIYNPTEESRELFLVATNDGDLYRRMITPIINNLRKKAIKGTYDNDKAVDAYYYAATEASNQYKKDFGYSFSVQDRFTAAVEMEEHYRDDEVFYGI